MFPHTVFSASSQIEILKFIDAEQQDVGWNGQADRAFDGITNGKYSEGSVTHTKSSGANVWWEGKLEYPSRIFKIRVFNRTDACCKERLENFRVIVSKNNLLNSGQFLTEKTINELKSGNTYVSNYINGNYNSIYYTLTQETYGQYVYIVNKMGYLSLAEVEVLGSPVPLKFKNNSAKQINDGAGGTGPANNAIDGNVDGNYSNRSLTHTQLTKNAWWFGVLATVSSVDKVVLYNRTDCCQERLHGAHVIVTSSEIKGDPSEVRSKLQQYLFESTLSGGGVTDIFVSKDPVRVSSKPTDQGGVSFNPRFEVEMPKGTHGQYVYVYNGDGDYLSLAEVEVFGKPELINFNRFDAAQIDTAYKGWAYKAFDGNADGTYWNGSVTHTRSGRNVWLKGELDQRIQMDNVVLYNRTDCCSIRLNGAYVIVTNFPVKDSRNSSVGDKLASYVFNSSIPGGSGVIDIFVSKPVKLEAGNPVIEVGMPAGANGRYVYVFLKEGLLSLAEVKVHRRR